MARKIYYKIIDDGNNRITDDQWDSILRLQHWYNSEFIWTAGRLGFRMYAVFPNHLTGKAADNEVHRRIRERLRELRSQGLSENESLLRLESDGLIVIQRGGYFDKCIASGFTRVAGNEFNAYLVCEFLLKSSIAAPDAVITAYDEGKFIKSKTVQFSKGGVTLCVTEPAKKNYFMEMITHRHVFGIVDPAKYDRHPRFETTISDYNGLDMDEKLSIIKDWNWLGFDDNYDRDGDDIQGFDLNRKVRKFSLNILYPENS